MEVEMTKGKPAKKRGNSCRSSHLKNAKTPEKKLPTKTLSQIKTKATSAGATTTQTTFEDTPTSSSTVSQSCTLKQTKKKRKKKSHQHQPPELLLPLQKHSKRILE
jgi:hypothetical protein